MEQYTIHKNIGSPAEQILLLLATTIVTGMAIERPILTDQSIHSLYRVSRDFMLMYQVRLESLNRVLGPMTQRTRDCLLRAFPPCPDRPSDCQAMLHAFPF